MPKYHPIAWLRGQAVTGVRDMPGNAAWLARRVRQSSGTTLHRASDKVTGARKAVGQSVSAAGRGVVAAVPFVGRSDESLEVRRGGASVAGDEAQDAEERAERLAQEACDRAEESAAAARRVLAEARDLADQALHAAIEAATALAGRESEHSADEASNRRAGSEATGGSARTDPATSVTLNGQSKAELLRRAAELEIEGRTTMSKAELVRAIKTGLASSD